MMPPINVSGAAAAAAQPLPAQPSAFGRSVSNPAAGAGPAGGRAAAQATPLGADVKTALSIRTANIATTQPGATLPQIIKEYDDAWQSAINDANLTLPKNQRVPADSVLLDNPSDATDPYLQPGFIIGNFDAFPLDHQALLLKDLSHMASDNSLHQSTRWEAAMGFCLYSTENTEKKAILGALLHNLRHATPEYAQALAAYNADDLVGCLAAMATDKNCAYMQQFGKYLPAEAGVKELVQTLSARAPQGTAYITIANTNAIAFSIPPGTPPSRSGGTLMLANLANRLQGFLPASVARASARTILNTPFSEIPENDPRRDRAKQVIDDQVYKIVADPFLAQTTKGQGHEFLNKLLPLLENPRTNTKQYTLFALLKAADNTVHGEYPIHDPLRLSQLSPAQTKLLFDAIEDNIPPADPHESQDTKDLRKNILEKLVNRMMDQSLKSTAWGSQAIDAFWNTQSLAKHTEVFDAIKTNAFKIKTGTGQNQFNRNPGYARALGEVLKAATPADRDALIKQMAGLLIDTRMTIEQAACFTDALEAAKPDAYKGTPLDSIPNGDSATLRRHIRDGIASLIPAVQQTTLTKLSSWGINLGNLPAATTRPANTAPTPAIVFPAVPTHTPVIHSAHNRTPMPFPSAASSVLPATSSQGSLSSAKRGKVERETMLPLKERERAEREALERRTSSGNSMTMEFPDTGSFKDDRRRLPSFTPSPKSKRPEKASSSQIDPFSTDTPEARRPAPKPSERTLSGVDSNDIASPLTTPDIDTTPLPKVADTIAKFGGKGSFGRQPIERGNKVETVIVEDQSVTPSDATLSAQKSSSVDGPPASKSVDVSAKASVPTSAISPKVAEELPSIIKSMNNASQVFDNTIKAFISATLVDTSNLLPSLLAAANDFAKATADMIDMLKQIPEDAASAARSNAKTTENALQAFLDVCDSLLPAADNEIVTPTTAKVDAIKNAATQVQSTANAAIEATSLIAQGRVKGLVEFFNEEAKRNAPNTPPSSKV